MFIILILLLPLLLIGIVLVFFGFTFLPWFIGLYAILYWLIRRGFAQRQRDLERRVRDLERASGK